MINTILSITNSFSCKIFNLAQMQHVSRTASRGLNYRWRQERGLPVNPNAHGPLTDLPDYSFLDGRPTPYGVRQRNRILKQREVAQRIIDLTKEVDFAVERHKELELQKQKEKRKIIDNKLKPKGLLLLKNK